MAEIVVKLVNGELAGKTAQSIAKEVTAAAQAYRKAEVGTKAWVEAGKKLDDVKKVQEDLKKQQEGLAKGSDILKNAWNKLPGAQYFNQVAESFGMMKKGVGGLVNQFGVLKTVIASSGIGLLVLLLGSLVTWFTKTEEGADKLKSVIYPLKALFEKFMGILAELGGKVFKRLEQAFQDPVQAIKDLGQLLLDQIINRFKALGVFGDAVVKLFKGDLKGSVKAFADAAIQMTTGVTNGTDKMNAAFQETKKIWNEAAAAGKLLLDLENAIEDAEAALVVTRAKLNVEAGKAMEIARDISKSDEERLAAAQLFAKLINQQTAAEENFLKLKKQRLIIEQDLDGILNDDEKLARAQMEAEIIQLQADNIDKRKKARALELGLIEEIAKREVDIAQNIARLKVEASQDGFQQELAAIEEQTAEKIAALQGSAAQKLEQELLLKEIEEQEMIALGEKYQAIENENAKKAADDKLKIEQKAADEKKRIAEEQIKFEQDMAELDRQIATDSLNFASDLSGKFIKNAKDAKKIQKTIGVTEIGINLQKELALNAVNAAANPLNGVTFGAAGAAQLLRSNISSVVRAGIATVKTLAFRKGGDTGSGQNDDVAGLVHKNEYVVPAEIYKSDKYGPLVDVLERARLGYQTGGAVSPINPIDRSRGPVSRNGNDAALIDYDRMAQANVQAAREVVDQKIKLLRVQNVATETEDVLKAINAIRDEADV